MNYDLQDSDLATVLAEASLVTDDTKRVFGRLSGEQVNWKPGEREWSIGQCFDHLIISNRPYGPIFEEILAGWRRQRVWERMPLLPRFFGRLLINTLRPDSGRRARARPAFYPSSSRSSCCVSSKQATISIWTGSRSRRRCSASLRTA